MESGHCGKKLKFRQTTISDEWSILPKMIGKKSRRTHLEKGVPAICNSNEGTCLPSTRML